MNIEVGLGGDHKAHPYPTPIPRQLIFPSPLLSNLNKHGKPAPFMSGPHEFWLSRSKCHRSYNACDYAHQTAAVSCCASSGGQCRPH